MNQMETPSLLLCKTKRFSVFHLQSGMDKSEFKASLKDKRGKFTLMCGAGVAMAISNDMKTWEKFVDQFAEKV